MTRPSDFSDGTWEARYERDQERQRPTVQRRLTADDHAERVLLATGMTCSCDDEQDETAPFQRVEQGRGEGRS